MTEDSIPFVNPHVRAIFRREKGAHYSFKLPDINGYDTCQLTNETGYEIVQKCDGKKDCHAIVCEMYEKYAEAGITFQRIKVDVEQTLRYLTGKGIIEWHLPKWRPSTAYVESLGGGLLSICDEMSIAEVTKFVKQKHDSDSTFLCATKGISTTPISSGIPIVEAKNSLIAYIDEDGDIQGLINIVVFDEDLNCGILSNIALNKIEVRLLPSLVRKSFEIAKNVLQLSSVEMKMGRVWVGGFENQSCIEWQSVVEQAGFEKEIVLIGESSVGDVHSYVLKLD